MRGYLLYCHVPVSFDQSGPSPLTSLIIKVFLPAELLLTGCFLFFTKKNIPFSVYSREMRVKIRGDQQFLRYSNRHVWHQQITFLPHSDIWSEKQLNLLTKSVCFYAFSCCHMSTYLH